MGSTIHADGIQLWVGKARSLSNGKWPKRAIGAAQNRIPREMAALQRDHAETCQRLNAEDKRRNLHDRQSRPKSLRLNLLPYSDKSRMTKCLVVVSTTSQ